MDFEADFTNWLSGALATEPPATVVAFSFNLFELAAHEDGQFGVELIGAASFDPEDSDWACDEVWTPAARQLLIPLSWSGEEWSGCLARVVALVKGTLKSDAAFSALLRSRLVVAVGFVDGELDIVWSKASDA